MPMPTTGFTRCSKGMSEVLLEDGEDERAFRIDQVIKATSGSDDLVYPATFTIDAKLLGDARDALENCFEDAAGETDEGCLMHEGDVVISDSAEFWQTYARFRGGERVSGLDATSKLERLIIYARDRFENEVVEWLCDDHSHLLDESPEERARYFAWMRQIGHDIGLDFDALIAKHGDDKLRRLIAES